MSGKNTYRLLYNSRFYILAFSVLLSVATFAYLRLAIPNNQVFYIRSQQLFGLYAAICWYLALIISPIGYTIGKHHIKGLTFSRRAIGVSGFYFALLHSVVAFFGQLGGSLQLSHLPDIFQWSLLAGLIALIVLLLLALTSFDRTIAYMTFRKWKWLHRLTYTGGILAMLHIWMIGTHLAYRNIQLSAFIALVLLLGLELYRVTRLLNDTYLHLKKPEAATMFVAVWSIAIASLLTVPYYVNNYHSRHNQDSNGSSQHGDH